MTTKFHHTRGVYPDGSYKDNGVLPELLEKHIEYNKTMRPGRALFVDGVCIYKGFVTEDTLTAMTVRLKNFPVIMNRDTQPYV